MRRRVIPWFAIALAACGDGARLSAPADVAAFGRFVVIGTGLSMGEQSAGVVHESQLAAWPSRLAARVGVPFRIPAMRTPGCAPPLVAPLSLYRNLAGPAGGNAVACNGRLGSDSLPANSVAIGGATANDALHTTPRTFVTAPASLDQARYPLVLPATQTQVQAMRAQRPTLVAIELGAGEVLRTTTGLVIVGSGYAQKGVWTLMPAAVFAPVFDSIADSVAVTGARAVFIGVPQIMSLPAWRSGDVLWQQRAGLAAYGVTVAGDCEGSTNLLNTVALIPPLVSTARSTGTAQALSCADRPGVADYVLTAADAALVTQTVTAINAAIKAAADKRQFPYVDVPLLSSEIPYVAPAFTAANFLGSDAPFGFATSLDGMQPSAVGHELIADRVATALNAKYGWNILVSPRPP